ncbi:MAG: class II aldolase/adducin family protein [Candidatus Aenigmarchaeota archaeon]|nr:class II aldolase/adducin family protein [Candidatus Aenigmarchaeota archaeon]
MQPNQPHYAKFETVFGPGNVGNSEKVRELLFWSREFQRAGLVPDPRIKKGGNLSFRADDGFVITPSAIPFNDLTIEDFVRITRVDTVANKVYAVGNRVPASEAMLHEAVYREFPGVKAVFHGECAAITNNAEALGLAVTKRFQPYGTVDLANEVLESFRSASGSGCVVMRDHGEVYVGGSIREAGEAAFSVLGSVKSKGYL